MHLEAILSKERISDLMATYSAKLLVRSIFLFLGRIGGKLIGMSF